MKFAALAIVALVLAGCPGRNYAQRCSNIGFTYGTDSHGLCQMELAADYSRKLNNMGAAFGQLGRSIDGPPAYALPIYPAPVTYNVYPPAREPLFIGLPATYQ